MVIASNNVSAFSAVRKQPIAKRALKARRRYINQVVILFAIAVGFALIYVWTRVQVVQLGYEVSRIRKETTALAQQKDLLKAEVARLLSPERLEQAARELFGMRLPGGDEIVIVPKYQGVADAAVSNGRGQ